MLNKTGKWQGSPESIQYRPGAGPFLALLILSAFGIAVAGFLFWYIPAVGLKNIHPLLPYVSGAVLLAACVFVIGAAAVITVAAARGRLLFYSSWMRWLLVKFFLPLMIMAGGIFKMQRITIEQAFIDLNNQMVRFMRKAGRIDPKRLLVLMPHCIQFDNCKIKVTRNVKNCAGCGKCEIGGLITLTEEFGINLFISTGGTVARRKVVEERPDAVIAVACERDLTSGLQDSYPLPVIAIVNKRPRGYCMETGVELSEVRRAIADLVA